MEIKNKAPVLTEAREAFEKIEVVIKGAGEMATGIAHRLFMANIRRIVMTEMPLPVAVRRTVAFCEAVYEGEMEVEGIRAQRVGGLDELRGAWETGNIGVIIDPEWKIVKDLKPSVVIDATMMKRYTGTRKDEAPLVIGVGPGFRAPEDVHAVVESNRGHNLGKVIWNGTAEPRTGIPGSTMGFTTERVLRAPQNGVIKHVRNIGDVVSKGGLVLYMDEIPVYAPMDGILRGLIREIAVVINRKIGDIDPRGIKEYCYTITDKARAIGGGVLEAIMHFHG
ncbi:MAG: molybdenum hydroxylase [Syntrophus sp. (in: bacteria)]|nr:molybdenum hydroxylase [Syntrophus sp. (in: bacteria)]